MKRRSLLKGMLAAAVLESARLVGTSQLPFVYADGNKPKGLGDTDEFNPLSGSGITQVEHAVDSFDYWAQLRGWKRDPHTQMMRNIRTYDVERTWSPKSFEDFQRLVSAYTRESLTT